MDNEEKNEQETVEKCCDMEMAQPLGGAISFAELEMQEAAQEAAGEVYELTDKFNILVRNVMSSDRVEDKAAAITSLAAEYATATSAAMNEPNTEKSISEPVPETKEHEAGFLTRVIDWLSGVKAKTKYSNEHAKSLYIWKDAAQYRWIAAYSNNRRDNDTPAEIISHESHKRFNDELKAGKWAMPELWLWHVPYPVGRALYHTYDETNGFPIAAGVFNKGCEWAAEGIIKAGWDGVSHGMPKEYIERSGEDPTIITRHVTREISPLPHWAAANKLAFSLAMEANMDEKNKGLPTQSRAEFVSAFGEEQVKAIEEALSALSKSADDAGIEKKEVSPPETVADKEAAPAPVDELVKQVKTLTETITALEARLKGVEEKKEEAPFDDFVKYLKGKSAIGADAAKVDGRSALAKDGPVETTVPALNPTGLPIGILDRLVAANQQYGGKQ